ncbi:sensor histidine kinase N-terminal domain-containing protein [Colwellia sp. MSW7]|uniref:histidine kinase n=1 Tax=Colwellia maritima TaxID=2912588 RepID=A0ABS9X1M7_9GAMM|nr:sensor histidine kinase N-terminal domain-containing protein [Colwellia maritima]MCI2284158.1 sensor histidine kinase N-terminal domain-containing protein [Colwellia maritima]
MSIRRYLVLTLFSALTLITFIAAIQGYKKSMSQAEQQFDRQLLDLANTLLTINSVPTILSTAEPTQKTLQVTQDSSFAFQVWKDQQLVLKSNNAPDHRIANSNSRETDTTDFFEVNFLQTRRRAIALKQDIGQETFANLYIIVAQPLRTQFALAQTLILAAVTPMIIAVIALSILIFIIITQGLKPLHQLTKELSKRRSNDFSPLKITVHNNELADIVATLNELFSRLAAAFQRERHFASDAAHELKTPLSVLKIDTHNLIQDLVKRSSNNQNTVLTSSEVAKFESIRALSSSVDRMGHVIDQILNLNRTNPTQISNASYCFNVNILLKQVISDLYNDILNKDQTITPESDDIILSAHEFSVNLLAVNLISNANKYTPNGGEIRVSVKQQKEMTANVQGNTSRPTSCNKVMLIVEDSGPGIKSNEYQRVFDRFYRVGGISIIQLSWDVD